MNRHTLNASAYADHEDTRNLANTCHSCRPGVDININYPPRLRGGRSRGIGRGIRRCASTDQPRIGGRVSDQGLIDALRDRIADLGDPGAVVIGYAIVVEVITPEHPGPWLKTLSDADSTPWAQVGRIAALDQITRHDLDAGWRPDEGDHE